jgi:chromosome partitioning protein
MAVIALLNQKGGVGKSSICFHISGTLAQLGRRVLLIDGDPQSSLSQGFLGPQATRRLDPSETIASVYAGDAIADRVIRPTGLQGIDLLPGSRLATDYNVPAPHESDWTLQVAIRDFLDGVDGYHFVLIDCPPNLHLCSWAALVASTHILVPLQPEDFGSQGLTDVHESIDRVRAGPNPSLVLCGYLLNMVNARATVHRVFEERLRGLYGDAVFATKVPLSLDFKESIVARAPVSVHKPRGVAAKSFRSLADELLSRLEYVHVQI